MKHLLISAILLLSLFTKGQSYEPPQYQSGKKDLADYLCSYLFYSAAEIEAGIEDDITATLLISRDGRIAFVNVTGKVAAFKLQVKRVLTVMHHWTPAHRNGTAIDTSLTLKILFSQRRSRVSKNANEYEILFPSAATTNIKPQLTAYEYKKANALYEKGVAEVKSNNCAAAIDLFNQAEKEGLQNANLYYDRGVAYMKSEHPELACQDWKEASKLGDEEAFKLYLKFCKNK